MTVLALIVLADCETVEINCVGTKHQIDNTWETCEKCCAVYDENLNITKEDTIIKIVKASDKFDGILIENKNVNYLPEINYTHPMNNNIRFVRVKNSKLQKIKTENFKNYQYLIYLDVSWNQIKILERNLFSLCQKLQRILLNNNEILFVDSAAFNNLTKLQFLTLENNHCCDGIGENQTQVKNLINSTSLSLQKFEKLSLISTAMSIQKTLSNMLNCAQNGSTPKKSTPTKLLVTDFLETYGTYATLVLLIFILIVQLRSCCCRPTQKPQVCDEPKSKKGFEGHYATYEDVVMTKKQNSLPVVVDNEKERNFEATDLENKFDIRENEAIYSEWNSGDQQGPLEIYNERSSQELYSEVKKS